MRLGYGIGLIVTCPWLGCSTPSAGLVGSTIGASGTSGSSGTTGTSGTSGTTGSSGSTAGSMVPDGSMTAAGTILQGPLAFNPNAVVAQFAGCVGPTDGALFLSTSNPPFTDCLWLGNINAPAGFEFQEELEIYLPRPSDPTQDGPLFLVWEVDGGASLDAGRGASLFVLRNVPLLGRGSLEASAIAGTVSVQVVSNGCDVVEMTGSFSATMSDSDGGQSALSGTFETTLTCLGLL
jgi:hypothetical protein